MDDNCNGQTDEGNPGGGQDCSTGLLGVCATGKTVCTPGVGHLTCSQNVSSSAEVCDGTLVCPCVSGLLVMATVCPRVGDGVSLLNVSACSGLLVLWGE